MRPRNTRQKGRELSAPVEPEVTQPSNMVDVEMAEMERRFELAALYKQIASSGLVSEDTEAGQIVNAQVKEFALLKMKELTGVASKNKVSASFTQEEVEILKQVAASYEADGTVPNVPVANAPVVAKANTKKLKPKKVAVAEEKPLDDYPLDTPFEENGHMYKVILLMDQHTGRQWREKRCIGGGVVIPPQHKIPTALESAALASQYAALAGQRQENRYNSMSQGAVFTAGSSLDEE